MAADAAAARGVPIDRPPSLPDRFGVTELFELLELAERFGQRPDRFVAWADRAPGWRFLLLQWHRLRRQMEAGQEAALEALRGIGTPRG